MSTIDSEDYTGRGVTWHKHLQKWRARIISNKRRIHLGYFSSKQDAITARQEAEGKYGVEPTVIDENGRKCTDCHEYKIWDFFNTDKRATSNKQTCCKICKKYKQLKSNYGVSRKWYDNTLRSQENRCPLCSREYSELSKYHIPVVDHCHTTNRVRGIICSSCNLAIGKLGDSVEALERVINYLRETGA